MPRFSVSLSDEQHDWLEQEAGRRSRSKADVVRECIDSVRTDEMKSGAVNTESDQIDAVNDLKQRVTTLEKRVDDLESPA